MNKNNEICIDDKKIGLNNPTYFIADIAANHNGDLSHAIELIYMAAEAGADAAKFQHFKAETIVSDFGFKSLGSKSSHQASWNKSVFQVYKEPSVNLGWTPLLTEACDKAGITFFTSPYDLDIVDAIDEYVPAYKIGSGDITWIEIIKYIAKKNKPYIIATGASNIDDVIRADDETISINPQLAILQCNTNYTASLENFKYINLNVLNTYKKLFPGIVLGLSDHTPGHSTVLGAVTLGARIIEKHFTDDTNDEGPDHAFSMDPLTWKEMVMRTRELEYSLGGEIKKIEENEKETVILQRRSIRLKHDLDSNIVIKENDLIALRPCPPESILPFEIKKIIGKKLKNSLKTGSIITWNDLV